MEPTPANPLAALLFLYDKVLHRPLSRIEGVVLARRAKRLPVVLTPQEVHALLSFLEGTTRLIVELLYGSGVRLMECICPRVKDIDFGFKNITVREGKGKVDRLTMLPEVVFDPLQRHLKWAKNVHDKDLPRDFGRVQIPYALARKYPNADREWCWQFVFPASRSYFDPEAQTRRRNHIHETVVQRAVHQAARRAGITKHVGCHTMAIRLQLILCPMVMIFGPFRNCWGTKA